MIHFHPRDRRPGASREYKQSKDQKQAANILFHSSVAVKGGCVED